MMDRSQEVGVEENADRSSTQSEDEPSQQASSGELTTQAEPAAQQDPAAVRAIIERAISTGGTVQMVYADAQARVTRRAVRPLSIDTYGDRTGEGSEVLIAFCELRQDERHFRLDRIVAVEGPAEEEQEDLPPF